MLIQLDSQHHKIHIQPRPSDTDLTPIDIDHKVLVEILKVLPHITTIVLEQGFIDHNELNKLFATIKETQISALEFFHVDFDAYCIDHIITAIDQNPKLQAIELYNVAVNGAAPTDKEAAEFAKLLLNNKTLISLSIQPANITEEGADLLAKALTTNNTLQTLCLHDNHIGDTGAISFANMLLLNESLVKLYLDNNNISLDGSIAFARALQKNQKLHTFYMGGNEIKEGITEFAQTLTMNQSLKIMDISNSNIAKTHCEQFLKSCAYSQLESLDLGANGLTDENIELMVKMLQKGEWSRSLININLNGNEFSKNMCSVLRWAMNEYNIAYRQSDNPLTIEATYSEKRLYSTLIEKFGSLSENSSDPDTEEESPYKIPNLSQSLE